MLIRKFKSNWLYIKHSVKSTNVSFLVHLLCDLPSVLDAYSASGIDYSLESFQHDNWGLHVSKCSCAQLSGLVSLFQLPQIFDSHFQLVSMISNVKYAPQRPQTVLCYRSFCVSHVDIEVSWSSFNYSFLCSQPCSWIPCIRFL